MDTIHMSNIMCGCVTHYIRRMFYPTLEIGLQIGRLRTIMHVITYPLPCNPDKPLPLDLQSLQCKMGLMNKLLVFACLPLTNFHICGS